MDSEEILQAVADMRAELTRLLGEEADAVEQRLNRLEAEIRHGETEPAELLAELVRHPVLRQWLTKRLGGSGTGRTFGFGSRSRYQPLVGQGVAGGGDEFICPEPGCDVRWFRRDVGQRPPLCEKHGKRLVPKE